ncbi:expressed unknown protein [Seminavis robusta]|uniref:Uncharacterized protein n=1 Tax=Seminavis robusta TaxID=568900 RepID=A0A9N8EC72_9STRA|nr:expressed unknown protein [Seminavis robusta]|eukprot:Sro934_g221850.1 n/a (193) ;mRNA; r:19675-20253
MPSKVSFVPHLEYSEPGYEITTSELKATLWYQPKEIDAIRISMEQQVNQIITNRGQDPTGDICLRGLENLLQQRISTTFSRRQEYGAYVQGLLRVQSKQQSKGLVDQDRLRKYSCRASKRARSQAELLAARDAMSCARIYRQDDDWKMLLTEHTGDAQQPNAIISAASCKRRGLRHSSYNKWRNLFARTKLH